MLEYFGLSYVGKEFILFIISQTMEENAGTIEINGEYEQSYHKFYDLMKFKVNNILLVASLYDAFTLEEDGRLMEQISGKYTDLDLTSPPRIIRVSSGQEALDELKNRHYDLVITMSRLVDIEPFEFGRKAKSTQKDVPVIMLVTEVEELLTYHQHSAKDDIDKAFFWGGKTTLFFAITKYVEDMLNIDEDVKNGNVRAILVVEDSPRFYSMFLPIIYTEIMMQTHELIEEGLNEHEKMFRKRARPKILLADCYDEAVEMYEKYKEHIMGVITDVTYHKSGEKEEGAGFELVRKVKETIPVLVQSSQSDHKDKAEELGVPFINKKSDTLLMELRNFFKENLGFGDFVFSTPEGEEIGRCSDMKEFEEMVKSVPAESLKYHAQHNHFSNWLTARGEIELAKILRAKKHTDFKNTEELRDYLITSFRETRRARQMGVITDFSRQDFEFEGTFTRLSGGSLGGKGRGLAFLTKFLNRYGIDKEMDNCRLLVPDTLSIGTDEFDKFMDGNELRNVLSKDMDDEEISKLFLQSELSPELKSSLAKYISQVDWPIAVRSSSLLEDSQNQPFAGIYSTYLLPNNCEDQQTRLEQICQAIKLIYASAFFKKARAYLSKTVRTSEEEKMAIVLQKLIGRSYGDRFYPLLSGVAQSYNFYPVPPLKREDGVVNAALGLGKIVAEGGKVLSFSPEKPKVIPGFTTPYDILRNSQRYFYALNMAKTRFDLSKGEDATLLKLDVNVADRDGVLSPIASTYDLQDDRFRNGAGFEGPKSITFSGILKHDRYPLVEVLKNLIEVGQNWMGRQVEIEFVGIVDESNVLQLYVLQIRPLVTLKERQNVRISDKEHSNALVFTDKALGNGVLQDIEHVLFVDPETFDSKSTIEIADEIEGMNDKLDEPYVLIGPGRWGTQDRFLGVPVDWGQISKAKTIVEASLKDFRIDPSQGTHFFHNMTSLGIMYFTIPYGKGAFVDWDALCDAEIVESGDFVKHVRFKHPLVIKVDGRCGSGVIGPQR